MRDQEFCVGVVRVSLIRGHDLIKTWSTWGSLPSRYLGKCLPYRGTRTNNPRSEAPLACWPVGGKSSRSSRWIGTKENKRSKRWGLRATGGMRITQGPVGYCSSLGSTLSEIWNHCKVLSWRVIWSRSYLKRVILASVLRTNYRSKCWCSETCYKVIEK